jgi:predicted ester cyclase
MSVLGSLLRGYLAAGDSGDLEGLGRDLHADVILHDPGGLVTAGLDHEKETWRTARAAIPDLRHEVQEIVGDGAALAARVVVSGTLRGRFAGVSANGRRFKIDQAIFMHVRDGKAIEIWGVVDTGSFLRQMGAILA